MDFWLPRCTNSRRRTEHKYWEIQLPERKYSPRQGCVEVTFSIKLDFQHC